MADSHRQAADCRGVLFDAYFVGGIAYDKALIDIARKEESPITYINRTERANG